MDLRRFLAATGTVGAVAFAGCSGDGESDDGTEFDLVGGEGGEETTRFRPEPVRMSRREQVQTEAAPVLQRWQSGRELSAVRRRLGGIFGAGLVVIAIEFLFDPGGITGALLSLWFLLSLPVAAIAACLLVLLKEPANAPELWWENGAVATAGLVLLAGFTRNARRTAVGRSAWQLFFGTDGPPAEEYEFGTENSEIDLSVVAQFRRYVYYAIVGSVAVVVLDQFARQDSAGSFEGLFGFNPGPAGWAAVYLGLLCLGVVIGGLAAAVRR